METEFIFVRHGETDWNLDLKYQGQRDIALNDRGISQARKVRELLADEEIDCLYTSDLKRARRTAEIIGEPHKLVINELPELREMNFGDWEGKNFYQVGEQYPDLVEKWKEDPVSHAPPGGETVKDFSSRVLSAVDSISEKHQGELILIVSHGGAIRIILTHFMGMPLENFWRLEVKNTSVSRVKLFGQDPVIKTVNYTNHLVS